MNTSSTCTRDNDRAAHAGFEDRVSFTMTWSMVLVSIACEALRELSSVQNWLQATAHGKISVLQQRMHLYFCRL